MKRFIAILITAVLMLCGCGSEAGSDTSSKKKETIFTVPQSIDRVTFALPPGTNAAPTGEDNSAWIFLWGDVNFVVAYFGETYDLNTLADRDYMGAGDYEFFKIGNTEAMHFDYTQDGMYVSAVTFNHLGRNYVLTSSSFISAEKAHEYYDELVETIELQPESYEPSYPSTSTAPVATARPADTTAVTESVPSFSSFSLSGTGSTVIRNVTLPPVTCIVRAEHNGRSNFIAHHLSDNGSTSYVANELGAANSYQVFTPRRYGSTDGVLDVDADGSWKITFIPIEEYFGSGERTSFSGSGNSVAGCFTASGMTFLKGTHEGRGNFIVHVYEYSGGDSRLYAFNEIGVYSGDAVIRTQAGKKYFFNIHADGYWTIDIDG